MKECSKSISRRLADVNFTSKYFVGDGLDIGGKPDPLALYAELFCRVESILTWDWEDGDAQFLSGMADESIDFIHSSHCLEHLVDPAEGLRNWMRVLRPGGHLIISVPDEDLYEQGVWPSTFNRDHKWTFTISKQQSWSPKSLNVFDLIGDLGLQADPIKVELLHANYRFGLPRYDQTLSPVGECGIEFIVRKRSADEIAARGRWQRSSKQPDVLLRAHLNQHRNDLQTLKRGNSDHPPFGDTSDL
jgi:SAM-dependent methyltransferase